MEESLAAEIVWAAFALLLIVGACELFTNGVEWFGRKRHLSEGAVGSVLAAVGTALPETIVPIVAILLIGGEGGQDVGIGGILGAPFMLATLAFFVTGLSVLLFARRRLSGLAMPVNARVLRHDVGTFTLVYLVAVGTAFIPYRWVRAVVALLLIAAYGVYVRLHLRDEPLEEEADHELRSLYFQPGGADGSPRLRYTIVQTLTALAAIFLGAHLFVEKLTQICTQLGADARLLALIVVPIATELPEKLNSVLWIRQGKDTLALGNITGAMVFQSCIPASIGILFTQWQLNVNDLVSAAIALISGSVLYLSLRFTGRLSPFVLLLGVVGYVVFLVVALT
jgi:cation:H+ antiporter